MRKKMAIGAGLGTAFLGGALLSPIGMADAGHRNEVLVADLDGRQEVTSEAKDRRIVGDPNGRGEVYVFGIDGDPQTLCYVLVVDGIDAPLAAHIHEGERGENGPVVANLAAPGGANAPADRDDDGDAADCLTEGEGAGTAGAKFPTGETVAEILANPGNYYVNVHNQEYPGGALRGQLDVRNER